MPRLIKPEHELLWGKLVKSWATGKNYFDATRPAPPLPRTMQEFKDTCAGLGIDLSNLPASVTGIVFVQPSSESLTIRIPPKEMVEASEQVLGQPGSRYDLPAFYDEFYETQLTVQDARKLEFHALRLGDYSISNCT